MSDIQEYKDRRIYDFFVYLVATNRIKKPDMYEKALTSLSKTFLDKEPTLSDLNEEVIKTWIDTLITSRTIDTIVRYVASLSKIYKFAVTLGIASDKTLLNKIKAYVVGLSEAGIDKSAHKQYEAIRRLSKYNVISGPGKAADIMMYSFYNAAMSIEDVIEMRVDSDHLSRVPQAVAIQKKYSGDTRKYVFPLQQWQQTTNVIKKSLEPNFKLALRVCDIDIQGKSIADFLGESWVAVAKLSGVSIPDICACYPSILKCEKLSSITPSNLTLAKKEKIKKIVANKIIDMSKHWYAIRFVGDETQIRKEVERCVGKESVKVYYPIEEIYKKVGKKRVVESRPTIRNIMFVQTFADTISAIQRNKTADVKFVIVKNSPNDITPAIIPDAEMRRFSVLVSNGLDILGDDDIKNYDIEVGSYVRITDGMLNGYEGRVLKVIRKDNSSETMLQVEAENFGPNMKKVFGKHLNITVPQSLVEKYAEVDK